MKKQKKVLALVLCAVMLVASSVLATMAYLTSTTEVVNNTFTVGKVEITLDEAKVDVYGEKDGNSRVMANSYKLIPGHNYVKDPTVHMAANSEDAWVFVKVANGLANIEAADNTIAEQIVANNWKVYAEADTYTIYVHVNDEGNPAAVSAGTDLVVFEKFTLADKADVAAYADAQITIQAYAAQADGLSVDEAYAELF